MTSEARGANLTLIPKRDWGRAERDLGGLARLSKFLLPLSNPPPALPPTQTRVSLPAPQGLKSAAGPTEPPTPTERNPQAQTSLKATSSA